MDMDYKQATLFHKDVNCDERANFHQERVDDYEERANNYKARVDDYKERANIYQA